MKKKKLCVLVLFVALFCGIYDVNAVSMIPNNGGFKCVYSVPYVSNLPGENNATRYFEVIFEREDENTTVANNANIKFTMINNIDTNDCGGGCQYKSPANDYNDNNIATHVFLNYERITITSFVNSKSQWECPSSIQSVVASEWISGNQGWSVVFGLNSFSTEIDGEMVTSKEATLVSSKSTVNNQRTDDKIRLSVCQYTLPGANANFVGVSLGNTIYEFSTDTNGFDVNASKSFLNTYESMACPSSYNLSFCTSGSSWYIISRADSCENGYNKFDFATVDEDIDDEEQYTPEPTPDPTPEQSSSQSPEQLQDVPPISSLAGCNIISEDLSNWLIMVLDIIKIAALILTIVLGMFDFFKGIASGNADTMKKVWKNLSRRLIAVVILFLLPVIIEFVLGLVNINGINASNPLCGIK